MRLWELLLLAAYCKQAYVLRSWREPDWQAVCSFLSDTRSSKSELEVVSPPGALMTATPWQALCGTKIGAHCAIWSLLRSKHFFHFLHVSSGVVNLTCLGKKVLVFVEQTQQSSITLLGSTAPCAVLLLYHPIKRSIFHRLPQAIKMRDKLIDFNMAALSGEHKRMDIWRLITLEPVLITCLIHALKCSERQVCESRLCNAPFLCVLFFFF